ncbi:MAG TPA: hypothetical protein ENF90_02760 [Candidatus Bathyarchaeota archaeon]|nr:hypothetical protein [Candidatus Bathyarchaeota archaeon]
MENHGFSEGSHRLEAVFAGEVHFKPCNVTVFVVAEVVPVHVKFEVSPEEFWMGDWITLKARISDARDGSALAGYYVEFHRVDSSGHDVLLDTRETDSEGFACLSYQYPSDGEAYAFYACPAVSGGSSPQLLMSNPVSLTVSRETSIYLRVERKENSALHKIYGFLKSGDMGLENKLVWIEVKEKNAKYGVRTDENGYFSLKLRLLPRDNKATTYTVTASFEGDGVGCAEAVLTTPNGTNYHVCTTTFYGYKPSAASTSITVQPLSTTLTKPTKTPEELQTEAEQAGWLSIEHEFTWWYPWYRMHLVSVFNGEDVLDVGLAPLGCDVVVPYPIFDSWITDFINTILKAYTIGWITTDIAVLAAMWYGPQAFAAAFISSVILKAVLLGAAWNSVQDLRSAFIGTWVSLILGTVGTVKMLHSGLVSLAFGFLEAASKVDLWKFIYKFVYIPINMVFLMLTLNRLSELGGL